ADQPPTDRHVPSGVRAERPRRLDRAAGRRGPLHAAAHDGAGVDHPDGRRRDLSYSTVAATGVAASAGAGAGVAAAPSVRRRERTLGTSRVARAAVAMRAPPAMSVVAVPNEATAPAAIV